MKIHKLRKLKMWVAGQPIKVTTEDNRTEIRLAGDPVPEAVNWTHFNIEANRGMGRIVWVDPKMKTKTKKRKRRTTKKEV